MFLAPWNAQIHIQEINFMQGNNKVNPGRMFPRYQVAEKSTGSNFGVSQ